MQVQKNERVHLPKGQFEGNCNGCYFAKAQKTDSKGRIFCKRKPGGYFFPHEKENCQFYVWKIKQWIMNIVMLYIFVVVLYFVGQIFLHAI